MRKCSEARGAVGGYLVDGVGDGGGAVVAKGGKLQRAVEVAGLTTSCSWAVLVCLLRDLLTAPHAARQIRR